MNKSFMVSYAVFSIALLLSSVAIVGMEVPKSDLANVVQEVSASIPVVPPVVPNSPEPAPAVPQTPPTTPATPPVVNPVNPPVAAPAPQGSIVVPQNEPVVPVTPPVLKLQNTEPITPAAAPVPPATAQRTPPGSAAPSPAAAPVPTAVRGSRSLPIRSASVRSIATSRDDPVPARCGWAAPIPSRPVLLPDA